MFIHLRIHSSLVHSPSIDWGTTQPPEGPRFTAALSEQARGPWLLCVVCEGTGGEWRPAGVSERLVGRPGMPRQPDAGGAACGLFPRASPVLPELALLGTWTPKPGQSLREYFLST